MKKILCVLFCVLVILPCWSVCAASPTTWSAVDGLGRTLTTDTPQKEKFVGMFYWTWHYPWVENYPARNATEVLKQYPEAVNQYDHPAWKDTGEGTPYFWDEPLFGYYSDLDEYVLRKHAELLADADIDVIVFDCTNDTQTFVQGYETLFRVWEQAKADGVNVPQVAFMLNFFDKKAIHTELTQLYDDVYSKGRYEDLWFRWKGKPLVMANVSAFHFWNKEDREIIRFFNFRRNEAGYFKKQTSSFDMDWGWLSVYPQTRFGVGLFGKPEEIAVSVAQNAGGGELCAMNDPVRPVQGRSFAVGDYKYSYNYAGKKITVDKNIPDSLLYGRNFQQQWDYAIARDPEFVFVDGFNEWIAGRFQEWYGTENAFPDQFSPEYSRDIEPSNGVLKDHYYYQLVENVRRFKGTQAVQAAAQKTILTLSDWNSVTEEYTHYTGSTVPRDADGWKGLHYTGDTMRNDIVSCKACYDEDNLYFLAQTKDALTAPEDNWMRLYLDTDSTGCSPNWEGFEYRLSGYADGRVALQKWSGTAFEEVGKAMYTLQNNVLQVTLPRALVPMDSLRFGFKWSDNMQNEGDILDFYQNGDVAPGGRFCFVFDAAAEEKTPPVLHHSEGYYKWQALWETIRKIIHTL